MRGLERNKTGFFYALYVGEEDRLNAEGKKTGDKEKTYGSPVFAMASIAPANGNATVQPFGKDLNYTHILSVSGETLPITEESVLWLYKGLKPCSDVSGKKANYAVVGISESLNGTLYALRARGADRRGKA